MKEHPILFSGTMVKAILEGRKTQTRRVIKGYDKWDNCHPESLAAVSYCPYGAPGDQLWVRETWLEFAGKYCPCKYYGHKCTCEKVWYKADPESEMANDLEPEEDRMLWRPSIHMPRWASRITLDITGVRVQRLQDISEEDACNEGMFNNYIIKHFPPCECFRKPTAKEAFKVLWDSINADRGFSWDSNPLVWAISFKNLQPEAKTK